MNLPNVLTDEEITMLDEFSNQALTDDQVVQLEQLPKNPQFAD